MLKLFVQYLFLISVSIKIITLCGLYYTYLL